MVNLRQLICRFIDTGSAREHVIKDIQESHPNIFSDQEISDEITKLLEEGQVADRGAYLVWVKI